MIVKRLFVDQKTRVKSALWLKGEGREEERKDACEHHVARAFTMSPKDARTRAVATYTAHAKRRLNRRVATIQEIPQVNGPMCHTLVVQYLTRIGVHSDLNS